MSSTKDIHTVSFGLRERLFGPVRSGPDLFRIGAVRARLHQASATGKGSNHHDA